jgi:GNAT superfamily N-acetyltransferase
LTITDKINPATECLIESGLAEYNHALAGYTDARPLMVLISDPISKEAHGGLIGRTSLGLLFVDLLFVPDWLRGHGLGSRIMTAAEAEAKRRGCSASVLYTISFQAPGFYERLGYRVLGRIECQPPGYTRLCMTKSL